jgi:hypothetical protein
VLPVNETGVLIDLETVPGKLEPTLLQGPSNGVNMKLSRSPLKWVKTGEQELSPVIIQRRYQLDGPLFDLNLLTVFEVF